MFRNAVSTLRRKIILLRFSHISVLLWAALGASLASGASIVNDLSTFTNSLTGPSYTETFSTLAAGSQGINSINFSGNGFNYTASVNNSVLWGTVGSDRALGTENAAAATVFLITFTSGNVTAVGGNFFFVNSEDLFTSSEISLVLNDGTTATYTPSAATDFRGFLSPGTPITSLSFRAGGFPLFPAIDNLVVGTATTTSMPEPATWALLASSLLLFLLRRR